MVHDWCARPMHRHEPIWTVCSGNTQWISRTYWKNRVVLSTLNGDSCYKFESPSSTPEIAARSGSLESLLKACAILDAWRRNHLTESNNLTDHQTCRPILLPFYHRVSLRQKHVLLFRKPLADASYLRARSSRIAHPNVWHGAVVCMCYVVLCICSAIAVCSGYFLSQSEEQVEFIACTSLRSEAQKPKDSEAMCTTGSTGQETTQRRPRGKTGWIYGIWQNLTLESAWISHRISTLLAHLRKSNGLSCLRAGHSWGSNLQSRKRRTMALESGKTTSQTVVKQWSPSFGISSSTVRFSQPSKQK